MEKGHYVKEFLGELLGTFILVLFGCGSLTITALFSEAKITLFHICIFWGAAVTLGIYASRHLSSAHLNPAVSIAMVVMGRMAPRELLLYLPAQFLGAFCAAVVLYLQFSGPLIAFELSRNIVRGTPASLATAAMMGAYFPPVGLGYAVSEIGAAFSEGLGAFLLVLMVMLISEKRTSDLAAYSLQPVFIGIAVGSIVSIIAPISSSAINPARDFGPKLFMYLAGWKSVAIPGPNGGVFTVYILAPIIGAVLAGLLYSKVLAPLIYIGFKPTEK